MTNTNQMPAIPADLVRVPNDKGVTLSGGTTKPAVTASATKPAAKPAKVKASKVAVKVVKPAKGKTTKPATVIDPATGQPVEKVVKSIVPLAFKARYAKNNGTCGDDMAKELKAATTVLNADKRETLDEAALFAIAAQNKIDVSKYVKLNNGQKRMNVGNRLRGLLKAGTDVTIGTGKTKRVFKAEDLEA